MADEPRVIAHLLADYVGAESLPSWPISWGVALREGVLRDAANVAVRTKTGELLPADARMLAMHPDQSIRRMVVTAEPAFDGPGQYEFEAVEVDEAAMRMLHDAVDRESRKLPVKVGGGWGSVLLDRFGLAQRLRLTATGAPAGQMHQNLQWQAELTERTERDATLRCAIAATGYLADATGSRVMAAEVAFHHYQKTPLFDVSVRLRNLGPHETFELSHAAITLKNDAGLTKREVEWKAGDYEVRQFGGMQQSALPVSARSNDLAISVEDEQGVRETSSRLLRYNETFVSLADGQHRLTVALPDFFESYPYGFVADEKGVTVDLWPSWNEQPWQLARGSGKTHRIGVAIDKADSALSAQAVGYAFAKPPMPRQRLVEMQQAGAMDDLPAYLPGRHPRMETTLYDLIYNRNRGFGKMNWGDDYSALYTSQGRGGDEIVWNNLEGDFPYHAYCQFVRTGRYQYFKEFVASIGHWADVDFCDSHADPLHEGALKKHDARHTTGDTAPCHNWAQGFAAWYFATGEERPLEILKMMSDWIIRRDEAGFFKMSPQPYVRGCGWGLIQLAAMHDVLAKPELEKLIHKIAGGLDEYFDSNDGLPMSMGVGGTNQKTDNAFHNATVVMGAADCFKLTNDDRLRDLAIKVAETFMDERTCTPEGIATYITSPEQDFPMQQAATFAMGGLGVAYGLTGETRFVKRGMRMLEYCLDRGMIVDHMRIPGEFVRIGSDYVLNVSQLMPNTQLLSYQLRGLLLFMKAAIDADMLRDVEYRY